jgi:hypothetical protein
MDTEDMARKVLGETDNWSGQQKSRRKPPKYGCGWLEVVHQVAHPNIQGFGNPQKGMEADPLFAALNFSNVNWMQVGFFCQIFLAHPRLVAKFPDGIAKNFEVLSCSRHSFQQSKPDGNSEHPTWVYF